VIFSLPNKRRWNAYLSKHWVDPYYSWFIDQKLPNIYRWCLDQDESGWKSHHLLWHFSDWNITRSRLGLLGLDRLGSNTMRDQASGPQGRQAFFKAKIWEKMWQFHADIWEYLARNLRIWMDLRWFQHCNELKWWREFEHEISRFCQQIWGCHHMSRTRPIYCQVRVLETHGITWQVTNHLA
jgi:hypothetical protein